jgi:hypothetical protein
VHRTQYAGTQLANQIEIDFRVIRPLDGDRRKGFEEFVCQLFRRKPPADWSEFRRVEGSGGDGGVEAYWRDTLGGEHGVQAKYFLATKDIAWDQVDKSVKTAIDQHATLKSYVVAFACDLTDRSGKQGKGLPGWEHWHTHKSNWEAYATSKGMAVSFSAWTKSELVDALAASPDRRGLAIFWFNVELFDSARLAALFDRARADLGERFHPEDNVPTSLGRAFEGLRRAPVFLARYTSRFRDVPSVVDFQLSCSDLAQPPAEERVMVLRDAVRELREISDELDKAGFQPLETEKWKTRNTNFWEIHSELSKTLRRSANGDDTQEKRKRSALRDLDALSAYVEANIPLQEQDDKAPPDLASDSHRLLVVKGEPGSGKSHLFADATTSALADNCPAILLLGQYFSSDIRTSFLQSLNLLGEDFDTVLQALDVAAELSGERAIILIDALNEAPDLRVWRNSLSSFVDEVLKHDHLALALSLRPEYVELLLPEPVLKRAEMVTHRGITTAEEQESAAKQYFEKRGITRPSVPWLAPEFSNFLFLRTVCDSIALAGNHEFPRGLRGSLDVLRYYLESVEAKVRRDFPNIVFSPDAVAQTVQKIASQMAKRKQDFIEAGAATAVAIDAFGSKGPVEGKSWFSILCSEGAFRRDHHFAEDENDPFDKIEDVYRFSYQRFSDHLIVRSLLSDVSDVSASFGAGGELAFLCKDDDWKWKSLWDALAVQIPEKYPGIEVFDVASDDLSPMFQHSLGQAFEQSLLWRSPKAFSDRTLHHFNEAGGIGQEDTTSVLLRLATVVDHPWNAEFLHKNLARLPMAQRDAAWSVYLGASASGYHGANDEIVDWCLNASLAKADRKTLHLSALALCWFFTTSSRAFRDKATKALIRVFCAESSLIEEIMPLFSAVDDLYVLERLCCAAYGAVIRSGTPNSVMRIAAAVHAVVFGRSDVPLDLTLRDYAKGIIQYAAHVGCLPDGLDIQTIQSPFKSDWPLKIPTEADINSTAKNAGDRSIRSSVGGMGDFGRYEVEPAVRHFTNVPLSSARPLNTEEKSAAFAALVASWAPKAKAAYEQLMVCFEVMKKSTSVLFQQDEDFGVSIRRDAGLTAKYEKAKKAFLGLLDSKGTAQFHALMDPTLDADSIPYNERELPQFNAEDAKRWIIDRAYGYGWTTKLFASDRFVSDSRGSRPKLERIGKKYQWLALGELQARLSDNVWSLKEYPSEATIYDHPADSWFARDVEPSLLSDITDVTVKDKWWQINAEPIEHFADPVRKWPFAKAPPTDSKWLNPVDPSGRKWLLLYTLQSDRQERDKAGKNYSTLAVVRDVFVRVSSVIVERRHAEKLIATLKGQRLADPSGHETMDWTDGPFLIEYPWRNTWDTNAVFEEGWRPFEGVKYMRPVARHVWESHLDLSLSDGSSICLPHPWIGRMLNIRPDLGNIGDYVDPSGYPVFRDPAAGTDGIASLVVDQDLFFNFLKAHDLECIWIIAGERNAYPSGEQGDYYCRSFGSLHRFKKGKWVTDAWHSDNSGHNSGTGDAGNVGEDT